MNALLQRRALTLFACALPLIAASAAPVGPALDRTALPSRDAARAVLLGAARAGTRIVAVGERGIVVCSDDEGSSWRQAKVPVSVTLTAVRFVDERYGWATGHSGTVLATTDGGQSWKRQFDGHEAARALREEAQRRGDPVALKEAERLVADGADKPFLDLHFFDRQRGIVVGAYNLAFSTQDGGLSWQPLSDRLDNPKALHLYAVRVRGETVLIAGEQGLVLKSDDQGRSFRRLSTPYHGSFFTAELPTDGAIVLAGLRGNVWRSTDGGASWASLDLGAPVSVTASALHARGVLLANQGGGLFLLTDGAVQALPGQPGAPATGLLGLGDERVLVLSLRGIAVSTVTQRSRP